jgi:putative transposase
MARIARVVAEGLPHHITQRGNYRQDVFFDAQDRQKYLTWIQQYSIKYGLSILAYCLMQNHVHFIAIPSRKDSLSKVFNTAHMRYSQYFNSKLRQRGHLWQGRFYSCVLDESHLVLAARYIERNPVRVGLVKKPWQWAWSSALVHTDRLVHNSIGLGDFFGITGMSCDSWKNYIDSMEGANFLQAIRKQTLTGRPLGAELFIEKLEKRFNRTLRTSPMGRPKQDKK